MKAPVSLKDDELLRLLAAARKHRLRDWVMILVTYWHGLRASETINLKESDLDGGVLRVHRGKGSEATAQALQEHENPLLNERAAVEEWLAERGSLGKKGGRKPLSKTRQSSEIVRFSPDDRLFPITRGQFWANYRRYAIEAGLPRGIGRRTKLKTHALKHTIAKHLIRSGVTLPEVRDWLGWKSMKTADVYLAADQDELSDRIGKAIRGKDSFRRIQQTDLFDAGR